MFSEWTVPTDDGVHVFWSTQSGAGPADLDSCPSSHHPALPVILILGHYIFHHPPFHLPLRHLYPPVDLWPSHSTAITLHFASGLKQSVAFQLAASQQRLCLDIQDGWESVLQFSKWFCDSTSSCNEAQISAKTKFTLPPLKKNCFLSVSTIIRILICSEVIPEFPDSAFPRSLPGHVKFIYINFVCNKYTNSGFFIAVLHIFPVLDYEFLLIFSLFNELCYYAASMIVLFCTI